MQIVSLLCGDILTKIPFSVGPLLGHGADGEVRELPLHPTRVVKFSIIFDLDYSKSLYSKYQIINNLLHKLEKDKPQHFAIIYEFGFIHLGERQTAVGKQEFIVHYCIMEKLYSISEDEEKIFHTILSHEDTNKKKNFSDEKLDNILFNFRRGFDFSTEEVKLFHTNLRNMKYHHNDIHVRNIMKNKEGKFKLIDFDRVSINE